MQVSCKCSSSLHVRPALCLHNAIADVITFVKGDNMKFGDVVKKVRGIKGYSQEQLARELGVSFATINRWENSKTEPSQLALVKFAEFCNQNNIDVMLEGDK